MKKENYIVEAECTNCHFGHGYLSMYDGVEIKIPKGTLIEKVKCPKCGNKTLIRSHPHRKIGNA